MIGMAAVRRWLAVGAALVGLSAWAEQQPTLVVAYRDVPPDIVVYCGNRHTGPLRDAIEEAASRIGHRVEWRHISQAESFREIKDGRIDVIPYLFTKTAERAAAGRYGEPLGGKLRTASFIVSKRETRPLTRFDDLAAFVIGYRKDTFYFAEFHDSGRLKKVPYETDAEMAKAFAGGDIDMVIVNNKATLERAFYSLGFNEFKYAGLTFSRHAELYLLYSHAPAKQNTFDRLDRAIVQMKAEGLVTDIYRSFDAMPLK
jgi:polar amino acid transport system substrate-binding protein